MGSPDRDHSSSSTLTGDGSLELPEFDRPPEDPISLLSHWLARTAELQVREPMAMVLATSGRDSVPSTRVVDVKSIDHAGVIFGSGDGGRKAAEFHESPAAAGCFYWRETLQQINVAGPVERLSATDSDSLFSRREDRAKAATLVSEQSRSLIDEPALGQAAREALERGDLSRPAGWSAYRLRIERIEFWHGSTDRLHRRLEYSLTPSGWESRRLQP